jgi:hypothetical protein
MRFARAIYYTAGREKRALQIRLYLWITGDFGALTNQRV